MDEQRVLSIPLVVMTGQHFRQMRRELPDVCDQIAQAVRERCRAIVPASA
ncbi:MAG: hypothetical protein AABM66_10435 [Actinomycetota bacterium]